MLNIESPFGVHELIQTETCHFKFTEAQGIEHKFHMPVLLLRTTSFKPEIISTCLRASFCQFFHGKSGCYLQRQKLLPAEKTSAMLPGKEHCSGKHNLVAFHKSWARISSSLAVLRLQFYCWNCGTTHGQRTWSSPAVLGCTEARANCWWVLHTCPTVLACGCNTCNKPNADFLHSLLLVSVAGWSEGELHLKSASQHFPWGNQLS